MISEILTGTTVTWLALNSTIFKMMIEKDTFPRYVKFKEALEENARQELLALVEHVSANKKGLDDLEEILDKKNAILDSTFDLKSTYFDLFDSLKNVNIAFSIALGFSLISFFFPVYEYKTGSLEISWIAAVVFGYGAFMFVNSILKPYLNLSKNIAQFESGKSIKSIVKENIDEEDEK